MIFQWPPGVASWMRWPPRQRPRSRVIESRHAAFVQENQAFRRRRTDTLDELLTLEPVGIRFAFAGVERLFFNRSSSFFTQRRTEDQLAEMPCPISIFSRNSAIVMSAFLNQSEHVNLDRFAQAARNAIARLWAARRAVVFCLLLAQLARILPTHTKAIGKNTTRSLAALIRRADPCPKIVGKCSSHPLLSRPLHQASSG
jgi:hypothetical protein